MSKLVYSSFGSNFSSGICCLLKKINSSSLPIGDPKTIKIPSISDSFDILIIAEFGSFTPDPLVIIHNSLLTASLASNFISIARDLSVMDSLHLRILFAKYNPSSKLSPISEFHFPFISLIPSIT